MTAKNHPVATSDWLVRRFLNARRLTERLCERLEPDDYLLQSMPECSPPKWHLAHTTWFFETFVLERYEPNFRPFHPQFSFLFNSYYEAVGERWPRPHRGLLSRPTLTEVMSYREGVNERMIALVNRDEVREAIAPILELGINHEEQHQELLLTDIKHALSINPLRPAYAQPTPTSDSSAALPQEWERVKGGLDEIGHAGDGFAFDNEGPVHTVYMNNAWIASRPVTAGEYRTFIEDGGYDRPELWLADGWAARQQHGWEAPLYWERGSRPVMFTLKGMRPLQDAEPVCHISFYEADAYARWAGVRLPTEYEWERVARTRERDGQFLDSGRYHPTPDPGTGQFYGDAWEWTASPYIAYPGYRVIPGALGEYNGKFMCNQMVLRGGSCVTPRGHVRPTYRNFFPPETRWQFSGLRLAKDESA